MASSGPAAVAPRYSVALIAALAARTDLILLDEPASGLDPVNEAEFVRAVREAARQGRTVFLSSQALPQVETLCARAGILRQGKLVTVADAGALRSMHGTELDIDLASPAPDLTRVAGVTAVERTREGIRVQLSGEPGPLLRALAPARVTGLRSRAASLEQIFPGRGAAPAGRPDGAPGR